MKKIRPIIKWTGGKYDEFSQFSQYLPRFDKYYEPFFGGGGTFFALQPAGEAFLNDKSNDLIHFYRLLNSPVFREEAMKYVDAWDQVTRLTQQIMPELMPFYQRYIFGELHPDGTSAGMSEVLSSALRRSESILNDELFIINPEKFFEMLLASVEDKARRLKKIAADKGLELEEEELQDHIETGIKSGFYLYLRHLTNLQFAGTLQMSLEKAVANWYFVREFCYASMFRYSRKGNFNIPYGGIAYNKKNFRQKVENLFSADVCSLFSNARFYNLDFEVFLQQHAPTTDDFIFLDPPYDSEFSEYDQNVFSKADQQRLRNALLKTKAKWMLVIKETDFIRSLYSLPQCRFIAFDKTYTYNVRGRNNRATKHLIIVNYELQPGYGWKQGSQGELPGFL